MTGQALRVNKQNIIQYQYFVFPSLSGTEIQILKIIALGPMRQFLYCLAKIQNIW